MNNFSKAKLNTNSVEQSTKCIARRHGNNESYGHRISKMENTYDFTSEKDIQVQPPKRMRRVARARMVR